MSTRDRGQTTLDFAIGASLFLTVVVFIFAFVPGVLSPFTGGTQEETVSADRVADQLAQGMLGTPSEPYVLDVECTNKFFEGASPGSCRYDDGSNVKEQVGVSDRHFLNVSVETDLDGDGTAHVVCWDESDAALHERDPSGSDQCDDADSDDDLLQIGPSWADESDVVTASRTVTLERETVTIYVRMW